MCEGRSGQLSCLGALAQSMIDIGKIGVWFNHSAMPIADSIAFTQRVEACGYGALWIPESIGREPFSHLACLASKTSRIVLATGIANIWARDAVTMAAAQKTLIELSGNRFLLGLGVSHVPLVEGIERKSTRLNSSPLPLSPLPPSP